MIPLARLVFPVLETTPQRWIHLAEKLTPELFQRKPAPKEWSAFDGLRHIVDTERSVFPARVGYLLRGEDFPAYQPGKEGEGPAGNPTPVELASEFAQLRAGHDLMHTVQGERAILQSFIDGCGPWKRYFSDHSIPPSPQEGR